MHTKKQPAAINYGQMIILYTEVEIIAGHNLLQIYTHQCVIAFISFFSNKILHTCILRKNF